MSDKLEFEENFQDMEDKNIGITEKEKEYEKEHRQLNQIFNENGIIKNLKKDYIPRSSQIEASLTIHKALYNRGHAIIEGPCGLGKTFAYSVPIFQDAICHNHRTVIVTNGISLQEQLFYKDLPFIQRIFFAMYNKNVSYAMIKGKGNYICKRKIEDTIFNRSMSGIGTIDIIKMYQNDEIKDGDLTNLPFVPSFETLSDVAITEDGECLRKNCPYYSECYYQAVKEKIKTAKIVVTNYHLLFSDFLTEFSILGTYDNLVCDEAHEIQNIHRDFSEVKITEGTITGIKNKFTELGNKNKMIKDVFLTTVDFNKVLHSASIFFDRVGHGMFYDQSKEGTQILSSKSKLCSDPNIENEFLSSLDTMEKTALQIQDYFTEKANTLLEPGQSIEYLDNASLEIFNESCCFANKASNITEKIETIKRIITSYKNDADDDRMVYWVENKMDSNKKLKISVCSKPTTTADILYENFFSKPALSIIITSATLSVAGNFDYIKRQLGLQFLCENDGKSLYEYVGSSPFNLSKQELWYLPNNAIDATTKNNRTFQEQLPDQIQELILATKGGALCLLTSYANLNYVADRIANRLPEYEILKQGDLPRTKLIEKFQRDKDSVLFATRSFFTGVDIPGDSLRCVILDKLPFPSPGEPVMMKLDKILGKDLFSKIYIPNMIITLKQAVGRGVRTINDKCVICILDGRMATASYKGEIASSFPYEKQATRNIEDVVNFINE